MPVWTACLRMQAAEDTDALKAHTIGTGRCTAPGGAAAACKTVYRILENWSTGNENFVKESEKTVDRFLKNWYDGREAKE